DLAALPFENADGEQVGAGGAEDGKQREDQVQHDAQLRPDRRLIDATLAIELDRRFRRGVDALHGKLQAIACDRERPCARLAAIPEGCAAAHGRRREIRSRSECCRAPLSASFWVARPEVLRRAW